MEYYIYKGEDELFHYGTKGMKWGIRRYQNKDGSLTTAGRKRYTNPDGTLNEKGKQYYKQERARLKAEQVKRDNQNKTNAKLDKLDEMRRKLNNPDKADDDNNVTPKKKSASDMTDKELQDKVNRLRNEDAYNDLSKKLGYDGPKTELDIRIAEMEKQKRYLELQRDINNLTPKQVSKGQKFMNSVINDVVAPAAKTAGKKFLENYLTEAGAKALSGKFKEKADDVKNNAEKASEKSAKKEAKQQAKEKAKAEKKSEKEEAKQQAKEAKQQAKEAKKDKTNNDSGIKFTVEGEGTSSRTNSSSSYKPKGGVVDMDPWPALNSGVTSMTTPKNRTAGSTYVNRYYNTPVVNLPPVNIAGYLPAPRDDR